MRGVWRLAALCGAGWLLCGNGCGPGLEPPGGAKSIPSMDGRTMTPPLMPSRPGLDAGAPVNNPGAMGAAGGGFSAAAGTSAVGTGGTSAVGTAGRGGSSAEVDAGVDDAGTP